MVKSRSWIIKLLLLFSWGWLAPNGDWNTEYRSMGHDSQEHSWGKIITFLLYVAINEFGDYLDKNPTGGYACPLNCGVDHKHFYKQNSILLDSLKLEDVSKNIR